MFVQTNGFRIMLGLVIIAAVMGLTPRSVPAATWSYTLTLVTLDPSSPGPAGTVTGTFTGDPGGDGILTQGELTHFDASWNPESGVPPDSFSIVLTTAFSTNSALKYTVSGTTGTIEIFDIGNGDISGTPTEEISCDPCNAGDTITIHEAGGDPNTFTYKISKQESSSSSTEPSTVPEPSTILLLSTGLLGVSGYTFSRRARPATTQWRKAGQPMPHNAQRS